MKTNICCFIGHRAINETEELKLMLVEIIEKLIVREKIDTFLFGSKSQFNDLCLELVTEIKEKYISLLMIICNNQSPLKN